MYIVLRKGGQIVVEQFYLLLRDENGVFTQVFRLLPQITGHSNPHRSTFSRLGFKNTDFSLNRESSSYFWRRSDPNYMEKVTVILPVYNEERNIERALKSVLWADEIMVIDAFSTDRTLEIAQKYTSFILQFPYENSAAQKNRAIPQANHPWIFILDADEVVTAYLRDEILGILRTGTKHDAFRIHRKNFFMGKQIRFSGWQHDKVTRFFRRDTCRYQPLLVHSEIETSGTSGKLKGKIEHHSYESRQLSAHLKKLDIYTTWGAYDRMERVKKVTWFHLALKPAFRFIKHYFFMLGFLDGKVGFTISAMASYTVFLRTLKLWRIHNGEQFEKEIPRT